MQSNGRPTSGPSTSIIVAVAVSGSIFLYCGGSMLLGGWGTQPLPSSFRQPTPPPNASANKAHTLTLSTLKDESEDTRIHSLVRLHVLIQGKPTRDSVEAALLDLYESKKVGPFQYHPDDPDIIIFAYTTKAKFRSGAGLWLARLISDGGSAPTVDFKEGELAALQQSPQTFGGLSEAKRRQLYWDVIACQDIGESEAERRFPNDVDRQIDWQRNHDEGCIRKACKHYRVSEKTYDKVVMEGYKKNWPMPPHR